MVVYILYSAIYKIYKGTEAFTRHGACRPPTSTRDLLHNALDLVGKVISINE